MLPQITPNARAEDPVYSGPCGDNLTWSFDPDTGTLTIEGSGPMEAFASEEDVPWYDHRAELVSLLLPEGLTGIGSYAFKDVNPNKYYYKAVLWAYENGVTTGTTPTTFSPNANCTRAQVVTFLYAAFGNNG